MWYGPWRTRGCARGLAHSAHCPGAVRGCTRPQCELDVSARVDLGARAAGRGGCAGSGLLDAHWRWSVGCDGMRAPSPAQIMFNLEKAHIILDEIIMNGQIVETNRLNVVYPLAVLEKAGP